MKSDISVVPTAMKPGVTILELLIAIALMAGMTLAVVTNYSRSARKQTVVGAAEELRSAMLQARANADSGKKDCGACGAAGGVCGAGDTPLQGWEVNVNTAVSPRTYTVRGICSPLPYPTGVPTAFFAKTENLPAGVNVGISGGSLPILFLPVGGGIYPALAGSGAITFTVSDIWGNTNSFSVNGAGEVR